MDTIQNKKRILPILLTCREQDMPRASVTLFAKSYSPFNTARAMGRGQDDGRTATCFLVLVELLLGYVNTLPILKQSCIVNQLYIYLSLASEF